MSEEQIVRGVVRRVTYRNPQNGYSVLQLANAGTEEIITVVGSCLAVQAGTHLMVRGVFQNHPRFGRQLQASAITETVPSGPGEIEKYLGSGLIKGIGEKTAERLVAQFGERTIEICCQNPEEVARVPGIGRKKAILLHEALRSQQEEQETMRFLVEHSISNHLAQQIYKRYGKRTVEVVTRDPYLLARELRGVGFITADSIAMKLGLQPDAPQRLKAGVFYALESASDDGHCFLPCQALLERAQTLLGLAEPLDLEPHVRALEEEGYIVRRGEAVFAFHLERAEAFVANFIAERCGPHETGIKPGLVESSLKRAEGELGIRFTLEQAEAVQAATGHRLLVITGGPGCGKTTVVRALSILFTEARKRLVLAAPTGRAAQRMSQVCNVPASTIHRLLKYDPRTHQFFYGPQQPLHADVVLIDESSMIDIQLARDLFAAIPRRAILILVGDKDQLPSVGPGKVFGDLIAIADVKTVVLSQLFRRSAESHINSIAHMINSGSYPDIPEPDGIVKSDAYLIPKQDPEECGALIESLVADQIPRKFGIPQEDIAVLTPSNRGPLGTLALNKRLQARLNPPAQGSLDPALLVNNFEFRVGDRVCQRVNNYQIDPFGVFNGDLGRVYAIGPDEGGLTVELWDGRLVKYPPAVVSQLSLAYAISVHRSQGSEVPCVILALHQSHYALLERQLIYTAVTRAKKLLVVVGQKRALMIASKRMRSKTRYCLLTERIQELLR